MHSHLATTPRTCMAWVAALAASGALAAPYSSTQSGLYLDAATWGGGGFPQTAEADTVAVNNGHVVQISTANAANNDAITVAAGGILYARDRNIADYFNLAAINLNGGRLEYDIYRHSSSGVPNGNVVVQASSPLSTYNSFSTIDNNRTVTFTSLAFAAGTATLSVVDTATQAAATNGERQRVIFSGGIAAANGGTIDIGANRIVQAAGLTIGAGQTLAISGAATFHVTGTSTFGTGAGIAIGPDIALISQSPSGLGQQTITLGPGNTLATFGNPLVDNAFLGTTFALAGGSVNVDLSVNSAERNPGGNFILLSNATIDTYNTNDYSNKTPDYGWLAFDSASTLQLTNSLHATNTHTVTPEFFGVRVNETAALDIGPESGAILHDTVVVAGKSLAYSGVGNLTLQNSLRMDLPGSAEIFATVTHDVIDYAAGTGTFTDSSTFNSSGGLWSRNDNGSAIQVTLANLVGTVAPGQAIVLASGPENAGHVELTGLVAGQTATVRLTLTNFADLQPVLAELAGNPRFANLFAIDGNTVSLDFVPTFSGSGYFAWDNVNSLGADVAGIGLVVIPEPASALLLGLLALGLSRRIARPPRQR